ncbi:MAG TPA: hypothetical protein VM532_03575, partial [Burkholderiales bacterium]|nr:hypothetical protein [Burkholderiales bacterium]
GDGSAALECDDEFKEHCPAVQRQDTIPKLVANIRLGMLIPAASLTTFDAYRESKNLPQAIILGLNRQDFPTNKVLGCIWLGATCLNTKPERTCEKLKAVFKDKITTDVATFEFSNSTTHENQTWLFWETHNVEHQMKRERWDAFIERVLFPSAARGPDTAVQCDQQKSAVQAAK